MRRFLRRRCDSNTELVWVRCENECTECFSRGLDLDVRLFLIEKENLYLFRGLKRNQVFLPPFGCELIFRQIFLTNMMYLLIYCLSKEVLKGKDFELSHDNQNL